MPCRSRDPHLVLQREGQQGRAGPAELHLAPLSQLQMQLHGGFRLHCTQINQQLTPTSLPQPAAFCAVTVYQEIPWNLQEFLPSGFSHCFAGKREWGKEGWEWWENQFAPCSVHKDFLNIPILPQGLWQWREISREVMWGQSENGEFGYCQEDKESSGVGNGGKSSGFQSLDNDQELRPCFYLRFWLPCPHPQLSFSHGTVKPCSKPLGSWRENIPKNPGHWAMFPTNSICTGVPFKCLTGMSFSYIKNLKLFSV